MNRPPCHQRAPAASCYALRGRSWVLLSWFCWLAFTVIRMSALSQGVTKSAGDDHGLGDNAVFYELHLNS